MAKKRVLILCTGNSAHSQMAEGLLRHDPGDRFEVVSAGTKPGIVRPEAIAVMHELGIDTRGHRSKHVDEFEAQHFDDVITVCTSLSKTRPPCKAPNRRAWRCSAACATSCAIIFASLLKRAKRIHNFHRKISLNTLSDLRRFSAIACRTRRPSLLLFGRFRIHMSLDQTASRAEINRANAQHSTGPKSITGKIRSSQNSFQHGLYSKQLILPGEDPEEFDHLRATLRNEHQPANTVEEILVDELAQHFWRMRRFRELEARALQPENLDAWCNNGLFALIQRSMASAERSFHKSLTALQRLQKVRGFVPQINVYQAQPCTQQVEYDQDHDDETGFVPSDSFEMLPHASVDGGWASARAGLEPRLA